MYENIIKYKQHLDYKKAKLALNQQQQSDKHTDKAAVCAPFTGYFRHFTTIKNKQKIS